MNEDKDNNLNKIRKILNEKIYNPEDKAKFEKDKVNFENYRDKVFLYYDLECDNLLIDILCDDEGNENQYFVDLFNSIVFKYFKLGDSPNNCAMKLANGLWFS